MQQLIELAYERLLYRESLMRSTTPTAREKLKADLDAIEAEIAALKATQQTQKPLDASLAT